MLSYCYWWQQMYDTNVTSELDTKLIIILSLKPSTIRRIRIITSPQKKKESMKEKKTPKSWGQSSTYWKAWPYKENLLELHVLSRSRFSSSSSSKIHGMTPWTCWITFLTMSNHWECFFQSATEDSFSPNATNVCSYWIKKS